MHKPLVRFIAPLAALTLLTGVTACSSDDDADDRPPVATDAAATTVESDVPTTAGDGERPFGVDAEGIATALQAAFDADDYEIDGTTIRMVFGEGSVDDVTARINCSVALELSGADDRIVLAYPDGELDCHALDGADGASANAEPNGAATGVARVTVGDNTWEFTDIICGFGSEGTGIEGAELNLAGRSGSVSLYVAIEPDLRSVEISDLSDLEGEGNYTTVGADEPDIEVSGKSVTAAGSFVSPSGTGPLDGTLNATCP